MIVVDASVVYKWIIDEEGAATASARILRDRYLVGKEKVIAPDILLYEIANILAYKATLSPQDLRKAWKSFLLLEISVVHPTPDFMSACLAFSHKYHISVYDASYVVLAKQHKGTMVTADKKLIDRVALPYVRHISDLH